MTEIQIVRTGPGGFLTKGCGTGRTVCAPEGTGQGVGGRRPGGSGFAARLHLWGENMTIKDMGYTGGYTLVNRRVQQIIRENEAAGLYPPDSPRTRTITTKQLSITKRISEEEDYVASRIR